MLLLLDRLTSNFQIFLWLCQHTMYSSFSFVKISGVTSPAVNMGADDSNLSIHTTMIPFASIFGQLFITVLFGLNVHV